MSETVLELGDIIQLVAPDSQPYHQSVFLIDYIDNDAMVIVRTRDGERYELSVENGAFLDRTIESIILLDRAEEKGYIAQNGIKTGQWLDLHFGGDLPTVITGQVSNVINDMIELTTFPDMETVYIDFQYQGVPRHIPLERVERRDPPKQWSDGIKATMDKETYPEPGSAEEVEDMPVLEEGETPDKSVLDELNDLYVETNEIIFGKKLATVREAIEVSEKERRYDIELQLNDLMEQLLASIPVSKRTPTLENNMQTLIARFKELRERFSVFQNDYIILRPKELGLFHKPMTAYLKELNQRLKWMIPVVKRRKKMCGGEANEYIDVVDTDIADDNKRLNNARDYADKQRLDNDILRPFEDPLEDPGAIGAIDVGTNIECIVNNLDDFKSVAIQYGNYRARRFAIETYLSDPPAADTAHVFSFMAMPHSMFEYSRAQLPGSNILKRVNEASNFRGLQSYLDENTQVNEVDVDDLDKGVDYRRIDIFKGVHNFSTSAQDRSDKAELMAESVVPNTKKIIELIRPYIRHKYSLSSCVSEMEPFMVYVGDITFEHYNDIKKAIEENINTYKQEYMNYLSDMTRHFRYRGRDAKNVVHMVGNLLDARDRLTIVGKSYGAEGDIISDSELLKTMINIDNGSLFYTVIAKQHMRLVMPEIEIEPEEYAQSPGSKKSRCNRSYLAKSFDTVDKMNASAKENEIFYDAKYDDTPYKLLDTYATEQRNMSPGDFVDFMAEALVEKHDTHPEYAKDLARTIIRGKKIVAEGDYAMVENMPRTRRYYVYKKKQWVSDASVDESTFMSDNDLFCNILNEKCIKNTGTGVCETLDVASQRIRVKSDNQFLHEILERMDRDDSLSNDELARAIEAYAIKVRRRRVIDEIRAQRTNNIAYHCGLRAAAGGTIKSPHAHIFQSIRAIRDFSSKQRDIVAFADRYTRSAISAENPEWKYCIDSGVPLVPLFMYDLAKAFITNGDYGAVLAAYVRSNGVVDGDSIRDKHSGMEISKLTFSTEEGYDESGFVISTRDILEEDLMAMKARQIEKVVRTFENPEMEKIFDVFTFLCEMMDVQTAQIQNKVLKLAYELVSTQIAGRDAYEKRMEKLKSKGKEGSPYEDYYNDALIMFVAGSILVSVQTAVPSIAKRKTFPGCVNSFTGYPYTGIEDQSGIDYIACVIAATRSTISPWNSIMKLSKTAIVKRIKIAVDVMIERTDVSEMYKTKRMYEQIRDSSEDIGARDVAKWTSFRPPLVRMAPFDVENITKEFHDMLVDAVKNGDRKQHNMYAIVNGKISAYTAAFIKAINNSVSHHEPLMKTYRGVPFVDNACCSGSESPLDYFGAKYPEVFGFVNMIRKQQAIIEDSRRMIKAAMLYHPENTSVPYPDLPADIREEDIYAAFIHYCNFDRNLPIPQKFQALCDHKPRDYPTDATIAEKMEFLKSSGKVFDAAALKQLLLIVNTDNRIALSPAEPLESADRLVTFLNDAEDADMLDEPVIRLLRTAAQDSAKQRHDQLKNYLIMTNNRMYNTLMDFIDRFGDVSDEEYNEINDFMQSFSIWNESAVSKRHHSSTQYTIAAIRTAGAIAPNMIINAPIHSYNPRVRKNELAKSHLADINRILRDQFGLLMKFVNDEFLKQVANDVSPRMLELVKLSVMFPVLNVGVSSAPIFDARAQDLVLTHIYLSIFSEYMSAAENPMLRELNAEMRKQRIREENAELSDTIVGSVDTAPTEFAEQTSAVREVDIQAGGEEMSKRSVSRLIVTLLQTEIANKNTINTTYESVKKRTGRSKDHEKKRIIKFLGDMTIENRKIEDMYKKYKMGRWNVGLQKGVIQYDKDTYERERREIVQQLMTGDTVDGEDAVRNMVQDVVDLDNYANELAAEHDREATDIAHLSEDYQDGIVDPMDE